MENNDLLIPDKIIKSKRKSISLIINENGELIVRCPIYCKESNIYKFINQKQNWIIKKRLQAQSDEHKPLEILEGSTLQILNATYTIKLYHSNRVIMKEDVLFIPYENSKIKLINFLKGYSKIIIGEKLNNLIKTTNLNYKSFSITSAKTCWGSCSYNNKLHFTYKLMLCPEEIVDYIIIHELCHTKEKNHSRNFWKLVAEHCPKYAECEKWLKQNRNIINKI